MIKSNDGKVPGTYNELFKKYYKRVYISEIYKYLLNFNNQPEKYFLIILMMQNVTSK